MSLPIIFRAEALGDLAEAFQWHEEQRPGLGAEFMTAIEAKLEQVQAGPKQFSRVRGFIRRAIVHRFPYGIFFVEHSEFVNIIAVMHHARDPKHWHRRVQGNR
ncbi:MAG: type II toxin-antitoxin system RelE/ParE family toxin [Candidatus Manganitrophaceae bacterium]